jgi:hypothetical protein
VAKLCAHCGNPLLRETSRFCNTCGASASSNAGSPAVPATPTPLPAARAPGHPKVIAGEQAQPVLREQIAFAQPLQTVPVELPAWMSKLDKMGDRSISKPPTAGQHPTEPPQVENPPSNPPRSFSPAGSRLPQRELRIKVWEESETTDLLAPNQPQNRHGEEEAQAAFSATVPQPQVASQAGPEDEHEVEELPTTPLPSTIPPGDAQKPLRTAAQPERYADVNGQSGEEDRSDADLPTTPLAVNLPMPNQAQLNRPAARPFPAQAYRQAMPPQALAGGGQAVDQQRQGFPVQGDAFRSPIAQRPVTPALPPPYPDFQQAAPALAPARPVRRKSKMRLVIVLALLLLLLVGGFVTWDIVFQPFSVPPVTQTSLSFNNTALGIALRYPQGWTAQLDQANRTVSFFDANHTDQVNVSAAATNGQSIDAYVKKEVAQIGLTAQKNLSPLTFAGTSWQQVQGSVLVSGATYTETLLVTAHGGHYYAIVQMAPADIYAGADHLFFSILRASFQFQ